MARKKKWVDRRCCDWDTFFCSLTHAAWKLNYPLILVNWCEARHDWRHHACTGYEALVMQRNRELNDATYIHFGPSEGKGDEGGNWRGGGPNPVAPKPKSPLLAV